MLLFRVFLFSLLLLASRSNAARVVETLQDTSVGFFFTGNITDLPMNGRIWARDQAIPITRFVFYDNISIAYMPDDKFYNYDNGAPKCRTANDFCVERIYYRNESDIPTQIDIIVNKYTNRDTSMESRITLLAVLLLILTMSFSGITIYCCVRRSSNLRKTRRTSTMDSEGTIVTVSELSSSSSSSPHPLPQPPPSAIIIPDHYLHY